MWTWHTGEIVKIVDASPTTKRFFINVNDLDSVQFKPGQFITLDLPIHERKRKRWRSYSIASVPSANQLELCIVKLENGLGTSYLFNELNEGDSVTFKGPDGIFVLPEKLEDDLVMICTGTGVAPFRSMLLHMFKNQSPYQNIHLIYGTRFANNILYQNEFVELAATYSNFNYHVVLSKEENWEGYKGHVHQVYTELIEELKGAKFMLCGWQIMIDEAVERLTYLGVDKAQIIYELYG